MEEGEGGGESKEERRVEEEWYARSFAVLQPTCQPDTKQSKRRLSKPSHLIGAGSLQTAPGAAVAAGWCPVSPVWPPPALPHRPTPHWGSGHSTRVAANPLPLPLPYYLHSPKRVYCGVMWCGVMWCDVMCGVMWCSVVWCGVMWCDVV